MIRFSKKKKSSLSKEIKPKKRNITPETGGTGKTERFAFGGIEEAQQSPGQAPAPQGQTRELPKEYVQEAQKLFKKQTGVDGMQWMARQMLADQQIKEREKILDWYKQNTGY